MNNPKVSFVVPCYKLGHLLPECVNSILSQSYSDLEVLIMDDCSPDNTPQVANSFQDGRIRHIRNNQNLGHLRNYNKGIELARGKYIWLISADDYLRTRNVLQRYVETMESNPNIGYTFCAGIGVKDGRETAVLDYSVFGPRDEKISGHRLLRRLLEQNIILAASALVRRECYEQLGAFPLDAQWAGTRLDFGWNGDWYLWCLFALHFDVAYFAEPMVCYREHELAMTSFLTQQDNVQQCLTADIGMLWLVRQKAIEAGFLDIAKDCLLAIANEYARHSVSKQYREGMSSMSVDQVEESLCRSTSDKNERTLVRAHFWASLGDRSRVNGDVQRAKKCYLAAISRDRGMLKLYIKVFLVYLGRSSECIFRGLRWLQELVFLPFLPRP